MTTTVPLPESKQRLWKAIEAYRSACSSDEHWARRDHLDALIDEMQAENADYRTELARLQLERDELRDRIDALKNQEPVGEFKVIGANNFWQMCWNANYKAKNGDKLYLAAGASPKLVGALRNEIVALRAQLAAEYTRGRNEGWEAAMLGNPIKELK